MSSMHVVFLNLDKVGTVVFQNANQRAAIGYSRTVDGVFVTNLSIDEGIKLLL